MTRKPARLRQKAASTTNATKTSAGLREGGGGAIGGGAGGGRSRGSRAVPTRGSGLGSGACMWQRAPPLAALATLFARRQWGRARYANQGLAACTPPTQMGHGDCDRPINFVWL